MTTAVAELQQRPYSLHNLNIYCLALYEMFVNPWSIRKTQVCPQEVWLRLTNIVQRWIPMLNESSHQAYPRFLLSILRLLMWLYLCSSSSIYLMVLSLLCYIPLLVPTVKYQFPLYAFWRSLFLHSRTPFPHWISRALSGASTLFPWLHYFLGSDTSQFHAFIYLSDPWKYLGLPCLAYESLSYRLKPQVY